MLDRCALLMAIGFAAPTLAAMPSHGQGVADRRVVALQWDGVDGPTPGVLDIAPDGSGTLRFQMMKPERLCIGTISVVEGQRNGSWALACGDGMAASGRYLRQDRSALGEGKGTDTGGRAVSFVVGQSLQPPPAAAAKAAPQPVEPKRPEARKEEPSKRPVPPAAASPREAASTTDALNEAELRKARERNWETSLQGAIAAPLIAAEPKALAAKAPDDVPTSIGTAGAGDQPCSIPGLGLDFGLSVLAANLSCRLLSGLGEQAALAQQVQTDRAKRAVILETCQQRLRDQPEAASLTDAQLRRRCETIGASFPLMVYFGGFPSAAERAQAVDACVAEGGAAQTEDQRRAAGDRCAAEVAARIEAARDPSRVLVQVQPNAPAPVAPTTPAQRPRKPATP